MKLYIYRKDAWKVNKNEISRAKRTALKKNN
jgi:hypothetical protein